MSKKSLPPHGNSVFPWERWTDLRPHIARKGQNFVGKPETFRRALFMHAKRNDLTVETRVKGDTVHFCFTRKESA